MIDEDSLYQELTPLCGGLGLSLVDCRFQQIKAGYTCQIILYKDGGVGTDDCAKVYRIIQPRLEILANSQDIHLEVSSPGTDRKIRLPREYAVFMGKGFTVVLRNGHTVSGVLDAHDESSISLRTKGEAVRISLSDIAKSKLDYTQEVR
jgi:ribosome maturation factor RimP